MSLFRMHKGSLAESLGTTVEVDSVNDIAEHLHSKDCTVDCIKLKHIGVDSRTGWDTSYVLAKISNSDDFSVVGMCDMKTDEWPDI